MSCWETFWFSEDLGECLDDTGLTMIETLPNGVQVKSVLDISTNGVSFFKGEPIGLLGGVLNSG